MEEKEREENLRLRLGIKAMIRKIAVARAKLREAEYDLNELLKPPKEDDAEGGT